MRVEVIVLMKNKTYSLVEYNGQAYEALTEDLEYIGEQVFIKKDRLID